MKMRIEDEDEDWGWRYGWGLRNEDENDDVFQRLSSCRLWTLWSSVVTFNLQLHCLLLSKSFFTIVIFLIIIIAASKCHHDDYHYSRHLLLLIMIATRESVREVGGLTQSSTCSHSITSSLSYSLLWWCHHNNNLNFDINLRIITTSPFLNVQLALTSVSSSRTSLTYERGCRAGMGNVWWQTRRGDLKLNSTASADFDKPYLPLPSVRVITGRWGGWTWNMWRGSGFRGFDHHSPNLPHHAHAHAHQDGNDVEDKEAWPGVAVARVTTRLCWSF